MARQRRRPLGHDEVVRHYTDSGEGQARSEEVSVFQGSVSEQPEAVFAHREQLEMLDEQGSPYAQTWSAVYRCDSGHLIGGDVRIAGQCYRCGRFLCSARGCLYSCRACGRVICREHAVFYPGGEHVEIYCVRLGCRWAYWRDHVFGF